MLVNKSFPIHLNYYSRIKRKVVVDAGRLFPDQQIGIAFLV